MDRGPTRITKFYHPGLSFRENQNASVSMAQLIPNLVNHGAEISRNCRVAFFGGNFVFKEKEFENQSVPPSN